MKHYITTVILISAIVVGCQSSRTGNSPSEQQLPRDGVVDIPIETAPEELRIADQVWDLKEPKVSLVVNTLGDGSRSATYFLEIGFEEADWRGRREEFHQRLVALGWQEEGERRDHAAIYTGKGRMLRIGFDTGCHPTTVVVNYSRLDDDAEEKAAGPATVRISIAKDQAVSIQGVKVPEGTLKKQLTELLGDGSTPLIIDVHNETPHAAVVPVIDAASEAGFKNVSLRTSAAEE